MKCRSSHTTRVFNWRNIVFISIENENTLIESCTWSLSMRDCQQRILSIFSNAIIIASRLRKNRTETRINENMCLSLHRRHNLRFANFGGFHFVGVFFFPFALISILPHIVCLFAIVERVNHLISHIACAPNAFWFGCFFSFFLYFVAAFCRQWLLKSTLFTGRRNSFSSTYVFYSLLFWCFCILCCNFSRSLLEMGFVLFLFNDHFIQFRSCWFHLCFVFFFGCWRRNHRLYFKCFYLKFLSLRSMMKQQCANAKNVLNDWMLSVCDAVFNHNIRLENSELIKMRLAR